MLIHGLRKSQGMKGKNPDFSGGHRIAWNTPNLPTEDGINRKICMRIFGQSFGGQVFSFPSFLLFVSTL